MPSFFATKPKFVARLISKKKREMKSERVSKGKRHPLKAVDP